MYVCIYIYIYIYIWDALKKCHFHFLSRTNWSNLSSQPQTGQTSSQPQNGQTSSQPQMAEQTQAFIYIFSTYIHFVQVHIHSYTYTYICVSTYISFQGQTGQIRHRNHRRRNKLQRKLREIHNLTFDALIKKPNVGHQVREP
jgi:hypothetical protein